MMIKNYTLKLLAVAILFFLSLGLPQLATAANYYWRATPVSGLYTNVNNWETAPGGGVSPAIAPGTGDDVFFPVASTFNAINFNGGNCRTLTVSAASPATFTFTGSLTALAGSINCNGQATFLITSTINFTGATAQTIQIGTSANVVAGAWNFTGSSSGTYTLSGSLNGSATFNFNNGQSFNTAGYDFSFNTLIVNGANTKTINFSNSRVTANAPNALTGGMSFLSPNATTTYNFTNTRLIMNNTYINATQMTSGITIGAGIQVSLDSLIFESAATSNAVGIFNLQGTAALGAAKITANVMKVNAGKISFGSYIDGVTGYMGELALGKLILARTSGTSLIANDSVKIGVNEIIELGGCSKNMIMDVSGRKLALNTTAPLTTTNTSYYGVVFGGSGLTASTSDNIGHNSGTVTWGAAIPGISYWWVGGTGNWNDPTEWSIIGSGGTPQLSTGCVPTLQDDVFFDANSFTGSQTVTIPVGVFGYCKNIDWSFGGNEGLLTSPVTGNVGSNPYGSAIMINGSADFSGARGVFADNIYLGSGTHTITSGSFFSYTNTYIKLQGTGSYTLNDALTGTATTTYLQHRSGNFNTNGKTVDVRCFFSASYPAYTTNLRNLDITNSTINLRDKDGNAGAGPNNIDVSFLTSLTATNSTFNLSAPVAPFFGVTKSNNSTVYLATVNLHNINFTSASLGYFNVTSILGAYTANFNDVTFANSAILRTTSTMVHNVNNYNLTSGYTYSFQSGATFNVLTGINHVASGCQELVIINGLTPGSQSSIKKAALPFNVNGAFISDINSSGVTMTVLGGVDNGNNTNVTVGAATGRTMYWVNNAGNWSDGIGHWSIGVSGGNPAVTNPLGCVPRVVDSVVFDNNSFTLSGQTVTLDVDGNCKGMLWTSAAGADAPIFAGAATRNLNNYGSMEMGAGMTSPFIGTTYMRGTGTGVNQNFIDMNGVVTAAHLRLVGGGRYDLLDSVSLSPSPTFQLAKGSLYTNSNNIYTRAGTIDLAVTSGNKADISNSSFISLNYTGSHNATAGSTWSAVGSTIKVFRDIVIGNSIPITYGNVILGGACCTSTYNLTGSSTQRVTFKKVEFVQPNIPTINTTMNGVFTMDTLLYYPFVINTLTPGGTRSYTVNDSIIAWGTPCTPTYIRSATIGTPVTINRTTCNTDLNFVNLRDVSFGSCTAAQNKVIGADEGGNSNVTITSIPSLRYLGPDTTVWCNANYNQDALGFGRIPGIAYSWSTGATANNINITASGTYSCNVTYAVGCTVNDSRVLTITNYPPVALGAFEQVSPANCTIGSYTYYEGAVASTTKDLAILAIDPNGNSIIPTTVKVNNQGSLVDGVGTGTFTNTGTGYYQSTDGVSSIRVTKRLHTVVAPGTFSTGGGVKVRVYYTAADTTALLADTWPGAASTGASGWFKHKDHTAQEVVDSMQPGYLKGALPITPVAWGTESGVRYAEFLVSNFSTFGFMAATTAAPLPLHLLSFEVQKSGDTKASIIWHTGVENQVSYMSLEHSINGIVWQNISNEPSKGSNSTYSYLHSNPVNGLNFYRLKIVDKDGSYEYSPTRSLNFSGIHGYNITLYPNPAKQSIILSYSGGSLEGAQIQLINAIGQVIINQTINDKINSIHYDISHLAKGLYIVRCLHKGDSYNQNLVIE